MKMLKSEQLKTEIIKEDTKDITYILMDTPIETKVNQEIQSEDSLEKQVLMLRKEVAWLKKEFLALKKQSPRISHSHSQSIDF